MDAQAEVGQTCRVSIMFRARSMTYSEPANTSSMSTRVPLDGSRHELSRNTFGSSQVILIERHSSNTQSFIQVETVLPRSLIMRREDRFGLVRMRCV
jgi:hypothetical protein